MEEEPTPGRTPAGWAVTGLGVLMILWAALGLASAGYGTSPAREFGARRSYNMVKRDVHRAFPFALLRGLGGVVLISVGARMRQRKV